MKIILIRHGESEANANRIHQGQTIDTGLSKKGKEQAKKVAKRLVNEKIEAVYSSDLKRAMETAKFIADSHNLKAIPDKRLREFDLGELIYFKDMWKKFGEHRKKESKKLGIAEYKVKNPRGESEWDHTRRIRSFLKELPNHKGTIAIVAHGGTNKIFIGKISKVRREDIYKIEQHNTCVNIIEKKGKKFEVILVNCSKHLE